MTNALSPVTWSDLARSVAWEFGIDLSLDDVDHILWEHTGFPSFWRGPPYESCVAQLRAYFSGWEPVVFLWKPS